MILKFFSFFINFKFFKSFSSERTGMGRFSPLFYGKKDNQLPFTDSDGLYDFPSSDGKGNNLIHQRKSSKRRERKSSRSGRFGHVFPKKQIKVFLSNIISKFR